MSDTLAPPPDILTRIWFAWACFFRVLFDASFAGRAWAVRQSLPALTEASPTKAPDAPKAKERPADLGAEKDRAKREGLAAGRPQGALALLSILQAEGRFVDFIQQDIAAFDDKDVGTAARVVHEGCRRALRERVELETVLSDEEGSVVSLPTEFDAQAIKLTGQVPGEARAVKGTLRHRGWRATAIKLPEPTKGHVHEVVFPAEVEL